MTSGIKHCKTKLLRKLQNRYKNLYSRAPGWSREEVERAGPPFGAVPELEVKWDWEGSRNADDPVADDFTLGNEFLSPADSELFAAEEEDPFEQGGNFN